MPALLAMLLGGLINVTKTIVGRVLVALGLSAVTYTGLNTSLDYLKAQAVNNLSSLGGDVLGMLGVMKVGESISIITSAMVARMVIQGLQGDTIRKLVTK